MVPMVRLIRLPDAKMDSFRSGIFPRLSDQVKRIGR